ncbi:MAG: NADH-quinone oxidoreductase subunit C [Alphaproteobacteria bacterium]|nr:NADH-quinone oxidoreductase subunit C [Alphaproteobacteria bacterium]
MIELRHRTLVDAVREALGAITVVVACERDEVTIAVQRPKIAQALALLRDHPATRFHQLMDVCGVDYPNRLERFDVVYQLLSLSHNWRLTVKVQTNEVAEVPSVAEVYPSAGWFEREVFDLYGVRFSGHPDLRRILTDYGFEGHPLRRDFPLTGFTEVHYDDLQRRVVSEPLSLQQDYRAFDALSPWQGVTDVQKRGEG